MVDFDTNGNFLLRENYSTVFPSNPYRRNVCCGDCFEGIFWGSQVLESFMHQRVKGEVNETEASDVDA